MLPVIGPIIAAGPLAAALISAAEGLALGGVVGALSGMGMAAADAQYYESEVKAGRTLVTVHDEGRSDEAWTIMQRHGAFNKETSARTTVGV